MIEMHRLNGEPFALNPDLIETIEATPDTVVRLLNGHRYVVQEPMKHVMGAIVDFRASTGYVRIPLLVDEN